MREQGRLPEGSQELENCGGLRLVYQPSVVPDLLQTAQYARRVITLFQPAYAKRDIAVAVAARLGRQTALLDPARRFEFLITEAALRLRLGSASMMAAQLDRIASLSTLENIDIGVIPSTAVALTCVPHGFVIFEAPDDGPDTLVLVETVHACLTVSMDGHVALYQKHWSLLRESAVFGAAARDLLAAVTADARERSGN